MCPGGIPEHPEVIVLDGIVDADSAKSENVTLGAVDVVNGDVEVELLGAVRVGELRWHVLRGGLERQPPSRRVSQHDPGLVFGVEGATEHAGVEGGQLHRVSAVDNDGSKPANHGPGISAIPAT